MSPALTLPALLLVSEVDGGPEVHRRETDGSVSALTTRPGADWAGPVSPDGRSALVVSEVPGGLQLRTIPTAGGATRDLGGVVDRVQSASWSPDGRFVVAAVTTTGRTELQRLSPTTGATRTLWRPEQGAFDPVVTPDASSVVFVSAGPAGPDLWTMAAAGGTPTLLLTAPGEQLAPRCSPSGERIAYLTTESGPLELRTVSASGAGARIAWRPAAGDGEAVPEAGLHWSPDGTRIALVRRTGDGTASVAVVDVRRGVRVLDTVRDADLPAQTPAWLDPERLVVAGTVDGDLELFVIQDEAVPIRLTHRPGADWLPRVVPAP